MTAILLIAALDLGVLLADKEAWTEKAEIFAVDHKAEGFEFASETRDQVNCLDPTTCVWHGLKVWETRVFFNKSGEEDSVSRVELSLYNRGDADSKFRKIDKSGQIVEIERGEKIDYCWAIGPSIMMKFASLKLGPQTPKSSTTAVERAKALISDYAARIEKMRPEAKDVFDLLLKIFP